jgi:hypothetical protein
MDRNFAKNLIKIILNFSDKVLGTTIGLMSTAPYMGSFASAALVSYISDRLAKTKTKIFKFNKLSLYEKI